MKRVGILLVLFVVMGVTLAVAQRRPPPPRRRSGSQNAKNRVEISVRGDDRRVRSNGLPKHKTGRFPNRNNPNHIEPQDYFFRMPLSPKPRRVTTKLGMSPFGVAVNGVPFDPGAAEFWNRDRRSGWQYEALSGKINLGLDSSNAHVQSGGAYHYHGLPNALIKKLGGGKRVLLIGYAADGFPIYSQHGYSDADDVDSPVRKMRSSYQVKKGKRPGGPRGRYDGTFVEDYEFVSGAGDLDECNGRHGATPEFPEGTYHYYITADFPFIPRRFRGKPDNSFLRKGPPPGRRRGPPGRRPGPPPRGS